MIPVNIDCGTRTSTGYGNEWGTTGTATTDCHCPAVWVFRDWPVKYQGQLPQAIDAPWLFDYDEPWTAPNHYPPAPRKLHPVKTAPIFPHKILKQPPGSMSRRGNKG